MLRHINMRMSTHTSLHHCHQNPIASQNAYSSSRVSSWTPSSRPTALHKPYITSTMQVPLSELWRRPSHLLTKTLILTLNLFIVWDHLSELTEIFVQNGPLSLAASQTRNQFISEARLMDWCLQASFSIKHCERRLARRIPVILSKMAETEKKKKKKKKKKSTGILWNGRVTLVAISLYEERLSQQLVESLCVRHPS